LFGNGRKTNERAAPSGATPLGKSCEVKSQEGHGKGLEATVEGKLSELQEEIALYRKERIQAASAAKKAKDALEHEVKVKREEMEAWANREKAKMEQWVADQRQAVEKEKKGELAAKMEVRLELHDSPHHAFHDV